MKLCWMTINVNNMEESLNFYQNILGLTIKHRMEIPGMELVFLETENAQIELIKDDNNTNKVNIGTDISIGLTVTSVDEWLVYLKEKNYEVIG
ncbi:VOC family protein, partial [Erysipelotrichaceae bacterium OttesenSCG-928-M19]|nr:VOC family protein [Erysipelotrichaceae bacterium OttesenSCG-928-M19]